MLETENRKTTRRDYKNGPLFAYFKMTNKTGSSNRSLYINLYRAQYNQINLKQRSEVTITVILAR